MVPRCPSRKGLPRQISLVEHWSRASPRRRKTPVDSAILRQYCCQSGIRLLQKRGAANALGARNEAALKIGHWAYCARSHVSIGISGECTSVQRLLTNLIHEPVAKTWSQNPNRAPTALPRGQNAGRVQGLRPPGVQALRQG